MSKIVSPLEQMEFTSLLSEGVKQVKTNEGRNLVEKYLSHVLNNPESYNIVNSFLGEARNRMYDTGVAFVANNLANKINENKYKFSLYSICEQIDNNSSKFNFLNRDASKQVKDLLENKNEEEVITYIKAGGLKNHMYNEDIRRVVKSIYKDIPTVIENYEYRTENPLIFTENHDDKEFFMYENKLYSFDNESNINEETKNPNLSYSFYLITEALNKYAKFDGNDTLSFNVKGREYQISESNVINVLTENSEDNFNTEQLRENSAILTRNFIRSNQNEVAKVLECIALISENYDNIVIADKIRKISCTKGTSGTLIEGINNCIVKINRTNQNLAFQNTTENLTEALSYIKKYIGADLTSLYEERLSEEFEKKNKKDSEDIKQQLEEQEIQKRRAVIQEYTQKYKDNPEALTYLSTIASQLNDL